MLGNSAVSEHPVSYIEPSNGTPSAEDNVVTYTLITADGVPQVNLTNLEWALFAELSPLLFTTPVAQGVAATNGSAVLRITVPPASVPIGSYFLVLIDDTGSITLAAIVQVQ